MAKLAFVLPDLAGGGAERVTLTLVEWLVGRGHSVDLLVARKQGELLDSLPQGAELIDLGAERLRNAIRPLAAYLRARRPDALQVSMWPLTIVAILARRMASSPARLVISDHTTFTRAYLSSAQMLALRASVRLLYPLADARVVVSSDAAQRLASLSGLPAGCFSIIYNPVLPPATIVSSPEVDRLWHGAGPRILSVGALKSEKNQALLIDAFGRLAQSRTDAALMILGEGELRPSLSAQAARLGIADRVLMPGFNADPWPFYASADLFVLSSDFEGYPLVLVEAMLAGLPVVSTDCPSGPREILEGGTFGALAPVGDVAALGDAMEQAIATDRPRPDVRQRAAILSAGTCERYEQLLLGAAV